MLRDLIGEFLKDKIRASRDPNGDVPHEHTQSCVPHCLTVPMDCGSQFFLTINDHTFGFDRVGIIGFRDSMVAAIDEMLAYTATEPVSPTDTAPHKCCVCGGNVDTTTGFDLSIGWMHFECHVDKETPSANP